MKKTLLFLTFLLLCFANYVGATPVDFITDASNSSVVLSGNTSETFTVTATLSPTFSAESFTLADGESYTFNFIDLVFEQATSLPTESVHFEIEATMAFSQPDESDITVHGIGDGLYFLTIFNGLLTWSDAPKTFTLLDGNELMIDFEGEVDYFGGTIKATVTNNPVPEPSTILLLGSGLLGLGWYGRKRKKA